MSDDDELRPRLAPPRSGRSRAGDRFVSQVLRQASRHGPSQAAEPGRGANLVRGARRGQQFGRGRVAARMLAQRSYGRQRRVVIKSRYVRLHPGSSAIGRHLRYIQRDGVTRDGAPGQAYDAQRDEADTHGFEARTEHDRHQFRFIVSPEDAQHLQDLRAYTRRLMELMEVDLETRLDWVAVDHWDTDNPHTHIVLRGKADHGQDLVIAPEYMSQGMRDRAAEIATQWLGPRTQHEIDQSLHREVGQARLTSLDRSLLRAAPDHRLDLGHQTPESRQWRLLRARLQVLVGMGLAQQTGPQQWRLDVNMQDKLQALSERGDIIKTLHRAMRGESREWGLDAAATIERGQGSIVGAVAGKGLADELQDLGYLVVDGVDGRAHYVRLPKGADLSHYPTGSIVEVRAMAPMAADQRIVEVAQNGLYRTADHLQQLSRHPQATPIVQAYVRRLEALRRANIVQRVEEGVWRVPDDLVKRGIAHNRLRAGPVEVLSRCVQPLEQQVKVLGVTWLDTQLLKQGAGVSHLGFGAQVHQAMQARVEVLAEHGLVRRQGQRVLLARNLLATLRQRELQTVSKRLAQHMGRTYRPALPQDQITGTYRQPVQLASGKYALIDDGKNFSLVPWRPIIENRVGQTLTVTISAGRVDWAVGRQREIGR
ncbi:DUF3363 domain-containing protein [Alcaligenes faecalis]|uniref:DUF3363 domain-containing protein n=1 Tax=Alcaligenes faecalis TaxID=511 RepID=UPI001EF022FE|nr:DUF3363 domain-containing protein [Alcaligenes faecalis]ULH06450.1 DUF3363 domain-containing protein [Alcaligenes faecalis]